MSTGKKSFWERLIGGSGTGKSASSAPKKGIPTAPAGVGVGSLVKGPAPPTIQTTQPLQTTQALQAPQKTQKMLPMSSTSQVSAISNVNDPKITTLTFDTSKETDAWDTVHRLREKAQRDIETAIHAEARQKRMILQSKQEQELGKLHVEKTDCLRLLNTIEQRIRIQEERANRELQELQKATETELQKTFVISKSSMAAAAAPPKSMAKENERQQLFIPSEPNEPNDKGGDSADEDRRRSDDVTDNTFDEWAAQQLSCSSDFLVQWTPACIFRSLKRRNCTFPSELWEHLSPSFRTKYHHTLLDLNK